MMQATWRLRGATPRSSFRRDVEAVHAGVGISIIWYCIFAQDGGWTMRTTLALDDELVAKAQAFTGLKQKSSLVREALKTLIERESPRRLARLGGSEPEMDSPPRLGTQLGPCDDDSGESEAGEIVSGESVVSSCDASPIL
jgi:Arc/MetJ family transcription regulator